MCQEIRIPFCTVHVAYSGHYPKPNNQLSLIRMLLLCQKWNKKTNSSKRNEIRMNDATVTLHYFAT